MRHSEDEIAMIMIMEWMPDTGEYDTVRSTPPRMDDQSAHFLEYKSF